MRHTLVQVSVRDLDQCGVTHDPARKPGKVRPRLGLQSSAGVQLDASAGTKGRALVWFKNDLRLDDHPGVVAAAGATEGAVFVYCLDPDVLAPLLFYPGALSVLVCAIAQLQQQLSAAGSDLIFCVGSWAEVIPRLAAAVGATVVLTEREVESSSQVALAAVKAKLLQQVTQLQEWDVTAWDKSSLDSNFRTWKKTRGTFSNPMPAPGKLPAVPAGLESERMHLPGLEELQAMLGRIELQESSQMLEEAAERVVAAAHSVEASREACLLQMAGGMGSLKLLDLYLRQTPQSRPSTASGRRMAEETARTETPAAEGASFTALFGWQLRFGVLSRRRVLQQAALASQGRPGWEGPSTPWVAATAAAERSEFHHQLLSCEATVQASLPKPRVNLKPQTWRWRALLADFCEGHPPGGPHPEFPAVLLLHGFGAFGAHWRFNVAPLTQQGYHVYAPTLPGFGRTEKVAQQYSQELWSSYLRDFVLHQVKKPVVLVGNSIGGFIASSFAAEYPELVRGLVLVNSAGPINPSFSQDAWAKSVGKPPPAWVAYSISVGLFYYLERTVKGTLKWLYPRNPQNADDWLTEEIVRAAADSGSLDVFKAVFYLPPPRALNYMVKELYGGPTLVLQGAADPLNDAPARAEQLVQLCPNASKKLIDAGHCPHDERPEVFNTALLEFLRELDASSVATSGPSAMLSKA